MKLIKCGNKDKYTYRSYTIEKKDEVFELESFENLSIVELGSFNNLDEAKKFIRKREKEIRNKVKCSICGYLKNQHKANGMNCPYNAHRHSWYLDTVFTSIENSKKEK